MNKLLSTLLAGIFASTLGASAFAAQPASITDAVKASSADSVPLKHNQMHKAHKSHKADKTQKSEHAPAASEATK